MVDCTSLHSDVSASWKKWHQKVWCGNTGQYVKSKWNKIANWFADNKTKQNNIVFLNWTKIYWIFIIVSRNVWPHIWLYYHNCFACACDFKILLLKNKMWKAAKVRMWFFSVIIGIYLLHFGRQLCVRSTTREKQTKEKKKKTVEIDTKLNEINLNE